MSFYSIEQYVQAVLGLSDYFLIKISFYKIYRNYNDILGINMAKLVIFFHLLKIQVIRYPIRVTALRLRFADSS